MESRFPGHVHPGRSSAPAPSVAHCGFQGKVLPHTHPGSCPQRSCRPSGLCLGARAWPPGSLRPGVMLSRPTVLCRLWAPRRLAHTVEALGAGLLNGRKGRSAPRPPREMRDQRRWPQGLDGIFLQFRRRRVCLRETRAGPAPGMAAASGPASHRELGALSSAGGPVFITLVGLGEETVSGKALGAGAPLLLPTRGGPRCLWTAGSC